MTIAATGVILYAIIQKRRNKTVGLRPIIIPLGKLINTIRRKKEDKEYLQKERDRLTRMLSILEKERDERIISIGAYQEMKKSIERKLTKLEQKMK